MALWRGLVAGDLPESAAVLVRPPKPVPLEHVASLAVAWLRKYFAPTDDHSETDPEKEESWT